MMDSGFSYADESFACIEVRLSGISPRDEEESK
jgi:hypothetical protein